MQPPDGLRAGAVSMNRSACAPSRCGEAPLSADLSGPDPAADFQEDEYRRYLVGHALKVMQTDFEPSTWRACWEYVMKSRPADELEMSVAVVYIAHSRVLRRLREELTGMIEE